MSETRQFRFPKKAWEYAEGRVRSPEGWFLAYVPYTLGDETDDARGVLFAESPALLEACKNAARAIKRGDPKRALSSLEGAVGDLDAKLSQKVRVREPAEGGER